MIKYECLFLEAHRCNDRTERANRTIWEGSQSQERNVFVKLKSVVERHNDTYHKGIQWLPKET